MSASSQPDSRLVIAGPSTCWRLSGNKMCVGVGELSPGYRLTRRKLVDLLVSVSSKDEIVVACDALFYKPVVEAVLVYTWMGYVKQLVFLGCCPRLKGISYVCV